jgi:hypothetical protein
LRKGGREGRKGGREGRKRRWEMLHIQKRKKEGEGRREGRGGRLERKRRKGGKSPLRVHSKETRQAKRGKKHTTNNKEEKRRGRLHSLLLRHVFSACLFEFVVFSFLLVPWWWAVRACQLAACQPPSRSVFSLFNRVIIKS